MKRTAAADGLVRICDGYERVRSLVKKNIEMANELGAMRRPQPSAAPATRNRRNQPEYLMPNTFHRVRSCAPFCTACQEPVPAKFAVIRSTERLRFDDSDLEPWLEVSDLETIASYCSCECVERDLVALIKREGLERAVPPLFAPTRPICSRCSNQIDVNERHRHYAVEMLGTDANCTVALMGSSIAIVCAGCAEIEQSSAPL